MGMPGRCVWPSCGVGGKANKAGVEAGTAIREGSAVDACGASVGQGSVGMRVTGVGQGCACRYPGI